MKIPSRNEARNLMRGLGIPKNIILHTTAVAKCALSMAEKIYEVNLNYKLVEVGGILHDIGRSQTHGLEHAMVGGEMLRNLGFDDSLARICETHVLGGLTKEETIEAGLPVKFQRDYLPETIEEKLVCLADKYFSGRRKVSLEVRFERWKTRWGKTSLLTASYERARKIEMEIRELTS
ncbi:MAG: HDIG domain-containing metalloprotein [Promethearchaeota archaeon]